MLRREKQAIALVLASICCCDLIDAQPKTIYVNNVAGSDSSLGLTPTPGLNGPKQSLYAAYDVASQGDTISIASTGVRYLGPSYSNGVFYVGKGLVLTASGGVPEIANITASVNWPPGAKLVFASRFRINDLYLSSGRVEGGNFISITAGGVVTRGRGEVDQQLNFEGPVDVEYQYSGDIVLGPECPSMESNLLRDLSVTGSHLYLTRDIGPAFVSINGGYIVTGDHFLQIASPPWPAKGFSGNGYVRGNVRRVFTNTGSILTSSNDRAEFPVGSLVARPLTVRMTQLTANPLALPSRFSVTVTSLDSLSPGSAGLPIVDGIAPGVNIERITPFCWYIRSDSVLVDLMFDLEIPRNSMDVLERKVRIVGREGRPTDSLKLWKVQGTYVDSSQQVSTPVVTSYNNKETITPEGMTIALSRNSLLVVANPFPAIQCYMGEVYRRFLLNPPLFTGNVGALSLTVAVDNPAIATASISRDTLIIRWKVDGVTTLTITATDAFDGSRITYSTAVISSHCTSVEGSENDIPTGFLLKQNYPNPFNPRTSFEFQVPTSEVVTLKIFDVLGREVATLVNEHMPPGIHRVSWDTRDLPSGVYLYKLQAGVRSQTKRMVLVK